MKSANESTPVAHTPGPWTLAPADLPGEYHVEAVVDGEVVLVALVYHDDEHPAGVYSNGDARLIAAAPDLLAACDNGPLGLLYRLRLVAAVLDGDLPMESVARDSLAADLRTDAARISAAIAKATARPVGAEGEG